MTAKSRFFQLLTSSMNLIKERNISINDERKILEVSKELEKLKEGFERGLPESKKEKFSYVWDMVFGSGRMWKWNLKDPEAMWPKIQKVLEEEESKQKGEKMTEKNSIRASCAHHGIVKAIRKKRFCTLIRIGNKTYTVFDDFKIKGFEVGDEVGIFNSKSEDGYATLLSATLIEKGAHKKAQEKKDTEEPPKENKKPEEKLTKYQKVSQALKGTATPSDKALNFLFYSNRLPGIDKIEVEGKLNWQTLMVLEAVDKKFLENINLLGSEEPEKGLFKDQEEFEEFSKALVKADITEIKNDFTLEVNITSSEIKNIMGKRHFSVGKVHNLVKDLSTLRVRALRFYDPSKKENKWIENGIEVSLEEKASYLYPIVNFKWFKVQKKDLRGRDKTKNEYQYTCLYNNPFSWIHLHNLAMFKFDLLSNKFRKMSKNAQTLYRCILWMRNPVKLNLDNINSFLGWKDIYKVLEDINEKWKADRIQNLKKKVKKILDELEDNRYLKKYRLAGYGRHTGYLIYK